MGDGNFVAQFLEQVEEAFERIYLLINDGMVVEWASEFCDMPVEDLWRDGHSRRLAHH